MISVLGFAGFAFANLNLFQETPKMNVDIPMLIELTATTTESIPKYKVEYFTAPLAKQGWCGVYQEPEGTGFTYLHFKNGQPIYSLTGCE